MEYNNGDIGKFRLALELSGFSGLAWKWYGVGFFATPIFNDRRNKKATPGKQYRRLKLWLATDIFDASVERQHELLSHLKDLFKDRYIGGEFIALPMWVAHSGHGKSLCIKLKM